MPESPLVISPLDPQAVEDYLAFFDRDAFADNPDWAACYCRYHFCRSSEEWERLTAEENRAAVREDVLSSRQRGCLAYRGGRVVGWCQAMPARDLPDFYRWWPELDQPSNPEETGIITCFVVSPLERGRGVARALILAACRQLRQRDCRRVEAYPRKDADSAAAAYHGPLKMYLDAGFEPVGETERLTVVRKTLDEA